MTIAYQAVLTWPPSSTPDHTILLTRTDIILKSTDHATLLCTNFLQRMIANVSSVLSRYLSSPDQRVQPHGVLQRIPSVLQRLESTPLREFGTTLPTCGSKNLPCCVSLGLYLSNLQAVTWSSKRNLCGALNDIHQSYTDIPFPSSYFAKSHSMKMVSFGQY